MRIRTILAAIILTFSAAGVAFAGGLPPKVGSFTGDSGHVTTGTAMLVKTAAGYEIHLGDDFVFDGAPDPRIGFGKDGKFVDATDFEQLQSNTGEQIYIVPASIKADTFDTIYVWCRKFSVPLGHAVLN